MFLGLLFIKNRTTFVSKGSKILKNSSIFMMQLVL